MPRIISRQAPADAAQRLAAAGIAPLLANIYAARGITDAAQLETGLERLLPFNLLKNASQMAVLLADAITARKKLLVVADYDADGATACAVAVRGLRAFGAQVDFIVPNRFEYGYGLTPEIVRLAAQSNPDILITVDNGIASVEGVAEAARLGMQVLVTDHHLPGDALPDALCIVNPNQPGCDFPSKNLAGVGVMFYVLLALRAELRSRGTFANVETSPTPSPSDGTTSQSTKPTSWQVAGYPGGRGEPNLGNLLDLLALGTVADVVKLDDNNRILVQQGLRRIRAGRASCGINALLQVARKVAAQASVYELGFIVGPRLNAAGRLQDMSLGIRCLLSDDAHEAAQIAAQLDELNRTRREIEADMQEAALAALEHIDPSTQLRTGPSTQPKTSPTDSASLTMFDAGWHQGVVGILASRLKDKFHRPVIAFARVKGSDANNDGELKGSGRSIPGLHLRDALDLVSKRHPHLLQKFGGHAMAAGVSIREEHFEEFKAAFEAVAQSLLTPADLTKVIETDGALSAAEFSLDTAHSLEQQVWGQGFPQPLFDGEFRVQSQRVVGDKHLKLSLLPDPGQNQSSPDTALDAIHFFSIDPLPPSIRAVYSLSINEYNGRVNLQLIIRHWQPAEV